MDVHEIPADLMQAAQAVVDAINRDEASATPAIASALLDTRMKERERAAQVALAHIAEPGLSDNPAYVRFEPSNAMARKIAAAIRS